jgi:hypothetical protein
MVVDNRIEIPGTHSRIRTANSNQIVINNNRTIMSIIGSDWHYSTKEIVQEGCLNKAKQESLKLSLS